MSLTLPGAGKDRDDALALLQKLCPKATLTVDANGNVAIDKDFCKEARALVDGAPTAAPASDAPVASAPAHADTKNTTPAECTCICDVIQSPKNVRIRFVGEVDNGGASPTRSGEENTDAYNGKGVDVDVQVDRLPHKDSDDKTPLDPLIIFAHELCGHAKHRMKGDHTDPRLNRGKDDERLDTHLHDQAINEENKVRAEQGVPPRPLEKF
ncbi:MAG TPA: hypothetical protein VGD50_00905 [Candidatus Baltobacteraceae bacterium]